MPEQEFAQPLHRPRHWRYWLLLSVLALVAGGTALAVWWPNSNPSKQSGDPPDEKLLEGKLSVTIRPRGEFQHSHVVGESDGMPARNGGTMSLDAQFEQPACVFFVWLDCEGRVVPLYPWNHETLEVKDINQPPPARKAARFVFNPPIGKGWTFGNKGGVETVLLLARRTPLEPGVKLGPLLGLVPPPKLRLPNEVVIFELNRGADSVSTLLAFNRGPDEEARAADEPLKAAMLRLREHFELIQAVRFAHVEE